jgi:hypothetical protein
MLSTYLWSISANLKSPAPSASRAFSQYTLGRYVYRENTRDCIVMYILSRPERPFDQLVK